MRPPVHLASQAAAHSYRALKRRHSARSDELMTKQQKDEQSKQRLDMRAGDILDPTNQIGVKLRSLYAAVQEEAIPERFLDLLEKLDHAEIMATAKVAE
jgi:hypothetical protein